MLPNDVNNKVASEIIESLDEYVHLASLIKSVELFMLKRSKISSFVQGKLRSE